MLMKKYAIGVDFGTESGRVVLVDVATGEVAGTHSTQYKHGVITETLPHKQKKLKNSTALQHPQDYLDVLETSIPRVLKDSGISKDDIVGIGIDFTSCTILPVDEQLTPLCFQEKWKDEPHAWVKLWKHHAAQPEADTINQLASESNEEWLKRYGGKISSEWMLPKILEIIHDREELYHEAALFLEAADWLTSLMVGEVKRNSCSAGYKGMWHKQEGYVRKEFLKRLHPLMENIYETKLSGEVVPIGSKAGELTEEFAAKIGLKPKTPVAIGIIDAHAAVPGAGVTAPGSMVMVMGTSTCHMLLSTKEEFVEGISGVVEDGIIPGYYGYEAGQAAVGDIFAWFVKELVPGYVEREAEAKNLSIHQYLEQKASTLPPGSKGLLALDWHNGNRTPLVDANLSGLLVGLTLNTKPEEIYRALIESTAFGTRLIIESFENAGIEINELVACGGLPHQNEMLMQIYADVTARPIKIASNKITSAIGAAMFGAVAAGSKLGGYDTIEEAAANMAKLKDKVFYPKQDHVEKYNLYYEEYKKLVNYFGRGTNNVMKKIKN